MCILLYVKLLCCSSIPYIYGQLEERGYMFSRYICIWQYVKHIWCSGVPNISGQSEGVYLPLVYVHSAIC